MLSTRITVAVKNYESDTLQEQRPIILIILLSSKHTKIQVSIKQNMAIRMPDRTPVTAQLAFVVSQSRDSRQ